MYHSVYADLRFVAHADPPRILGGPHLACAYLRRCEFGLRCRRLSAMGVFEEELVDVVEVGIGCRLPGKVHGPRLAVAR